MAAQCRQTRGGGGSAVRGNIGTLLCPSQWGVVMAPVLLFEPRGAVLTCIPLRGPESKAILYPAQLWPPIAVPSPRSILFRIALPFSACGVIHVLTAQRWLAHDGFQGLALGFHANVTVPGASHSAALR